LKSFLFKGELYSIEYKLTDGRILQYRIIPASAGSGLWIHPFIFSVSGENKTERISEIRITETGSSENNSDLSIEWIETTPDHQPCKNVFLNELLQ
jgi:hypothetical protein